MNEQQVRMQRLQQIPVFALRQVVNALIDDEKTEALIRQRFHTVLNRRPRNMKRTVQRMNREQLTTLVDACPEVSDDEIKELFEEYRYGSNPSFYIYLFNLTMLGREALKGFRQRFVEELKVFNAFREEGLPRVRRLALNDLGALPERPEIIEGSYRFQKRLDYIDEYQNAISAYETLYGFFWLNTVEGYAIIHARSTDVLKGLKCAVEKGADIYLTPLVISKRLKNTLPFLPRESLRSGRLHDPDPKSQRFRWLTIADDNPYDKEYERYEKDYPELRSARYREVVAKEKETSLTIRCDQGALSLTGKFTATQFRAWCLDRLGELIGVLRAFRAQPIDLMETLNLSKVPQMDKFRTTAQKEDVKRIISALLLARKAGGLGYQRLGGAPLDLAAKMGRFVLIQIPFECPEPDCREEGYVACASCSSTVFRSTRQDTAWQLVCPRCGRKRWAYTLPLRVQCDQEHQFTLDESDLQERMEVLPTYDLLQAIAGIVNDHVQGYDFDSDLESFFIRGPNLFYHADKPVVHTPKMIFDIDLSTGDIHPGAVVKGVDIARLVLEAATSER